MWKGISRLVQGLVPVAATTVLGACYQNQPPDGTVAPVGTYGGKVVAYPSAYLGYGSPFDYGLSGYDAYAPGYGYSPSAYGYGYSPYAYGYGFSPLSRYGYPYGAVYPRVVVIRSPQSGAIAPRRNGGYGLSPWGSGAHRIAVPRGSATGGKSLPRAGPREPPAFEMPSLRASGQITRGSFRPPQPPSVPPRPRMHYTPPPRPSHPDSPHGR